MPAKRTACRIVDMLGRKEKGRGKLTNLGVMDLVSSGVVSIFCLCFTVFSKFPTIKAEYL